MAASGRGRYKVFRKTYRMLQEGQAAKGGRPGGVVRLPRPRVDHRGREIEELDLSKIFRRIENLAALREVALRRTASILGSKLIVDQGEDVGDVVSRVARGTTYIFMGQPRPGAAACGD